MWKSSRSLKASCTEAQSSVAGVLWVRAEKGQGLNRKRRCLYGCCPTSLPCSDRYGTFNSAARKDKAEVPEYHTPDTRTKEAQKEGQGLAALWGVLAVPKVKTLLVLVCVVQVRKEVHTTCGNACRVSEPVSQGLPAAERERRRLPSANNCGLATTLFIARRMLSNCLHPV